MQRHRHQEFIRFLNAIENAVPAKKAMHVVLDNYAAHKHPKVIAWLSRHPRVTFHFTPTSASWLNAVEGFFAALTNRRLKRGAFGGIVDLQAAIKAEGTRRWIQSTRRFSHRLDRGSADALASLSCAAPADHPCREQRDLGLMEPTPEKLRYRRFGPHRETRWCDRRRGQLAA